MALPARDDAPRGPLTASILCRVVGKNRTKVEFGYRYPEPPKTRD